MKTYLSIDLDFWNNSTVNKCRKFLFTVKKVADSRGIEIVMVDEHHDLLNSINDSKCEKTVNLDFHSDIVNEHKGVSLNCGTWANYVSENLKKIYLWIYPHIRNFEMSYCHYPLLPTCNPFIHPSLAEWEDVQKVRVNQNILDDVFYGVKRIGIAISYEYLRNYYLLNAFIDVFGKQKLPKPSHYGDVIDSDFYNGVYNAAMNGENMRRFN